jgi:hypothetical protein
MTRINILSESKKAAPLYSRSPPSALANVGGKGRHTADSISDASTDETLACRAQHLTSSERTLHL